MCELGDFRVEDCWRWLEALERNKCTRWGSKLKNCTCGFLTAAGCCVVFHMVSTGQSIFATSNILRISHLKEFEKRSKENFESDRLSHDIFQEILRIFIFEILNLWKDYDKILKFGFQKFLRQNICEIPKSLVQQCTLQGIPKTLASTHLFFNIKYLTCHSLDSPPGISHMPNRWHQSGPRAVPMSKCPRVLEI